MPGPQAPLGSPLTGTPPPRDWRAFATEEAQRQGVDPSLVHRLIDQESKWNERAISSKGAEGLMQLMPETARSYGVTNPFDGEQNLRAGITHLKKLLQNRKGDVRLALADYNAGPAAVNRFGGVPPYPETLNYVEKIDQPPALAVEGEAEPPLAIEGEEELAIEGETPGFEADVAKAAQGATRLTPGYSGPVEFLRTLPAAAGSMLSAAVRPGGGIPAIAGAAVGGAGAALGEIGVMGAEKFAYDTGLSGVPPPTLEGAIDRAKGAFWTGAGGEVLGRAGGAVIGKAMAPFASSVDDAGRQVQRQFPDALPNMVADSPVLDAMTAVAEAGITGGGKIASRKALLANQAQQEAFGLVADYGGPITAENAGKVFQDALESNTAAFKGKAAKLYADVDNLAEGAKVSLEGLKEFAGTELEKRAGIPGEVSGNRGLKMLQQVARAGEKEGEDAQLKELAAGLGVSTEELAKPAYASIRSQLGIADAPMAKEMTFQQAQTFRSDLLSLIRRAKSEKDDVAKGVAQQLVKRLDDAMDEAAAAVPGLKDAYGTANKFYREGKQRYESELMRGLADQYPEEVVDKVIKDGATTPIREARAAVGEQAWKKVQARYADNLITAATDEDGVIAGDKLLAKLRSASPATLKEVYPNDEARALWALGKVLERTQRKIGATAKTGVFLSQSAGIIGVLTGHLPAKTAGILLSPRILAEILTSKTGAKWLTTGLEAPAGSKLAIQAGRKVLEQIGYSATGGRSSGGPPPSPGAPRYPYRGGGGNPPPRGDIELPPDR